MQVEKRKDGWWVTGISKYDLTTGDMGPYDTKKEADEDRIGIGRFFRRECKVVSDDFQTELF